MNLGEIKTQWTGLLNRRDITASQIQTFTAQGIIRIQRDLRVPAMEKKVAITIPNDFDGGLTIPADLLELKEIRPVANNVKLKKVNLDDAFAAQTASGTPLVYSRDVSVWRIGPTPAAGDVINVTYYAEIPALVNDTDTNDLTVVAWDLFVYAALAQAALWFQDKRADAFENQYQTILMALQDQADEDELGDNTSLSPGIYFPSDDDQVDVVIG